MDSSMFDMSTIVFALIAIFVVWRLYSVLGTRGGAEPPAFDPTARRDPPPTRPAAGMGQVIRLPGAAREPVAPAPAAVDPLRWASFVDQGSKAWAGLDAIAAGEPGFSPADFLNGAKGAYEMIIVAFAAGDKKTLGNLLAPDVLDNFVKAIDAREKRGETMTTTLVSIDSAKVEDVRVNGPTANIAVRFAAKLISATKSKGGAVIEGAADVVADHVDVWTFARTLGARDPNWRLAETETVP